MPKVPGYDNLEVLPGVRQPTRVQNQLTPEAASLPGRQLQGLAGGLADAGAALGNYAQAEQEKVNKVRLNDAFNRASEEANRLKNEYSQLKGAEAAKGVKGKPLADHYAAELEKRLAEIGKDMHAPVLREKFSLLAGEMTTQFRNGASTYEVEQGAVYAGQVRDATVLSAFNAISAEPSSPTVSFHMARARDALTEKFRDAGFADEALDQQVKQALGKSHTVILDQLTNEGRYDEAVAYFEAHRGDFLESDARSIKAAMDEKDRELKQFSKADDIWVKSGGDYAKALEEVRKVSNPRDREVLEGRIATLKNQDDAATKATQDAVINDALMAITSGQTVPAEVMRRADGRTRQFIADELRQKRLQDQQMATLTAQEKAAMKEASNISKEYLTSFGADPRMASTYLEGPAAWKDTAPTMYDLYASLTPEHRAEMIADINTRRGAGETSTASDKVFADLIQSVPMLQPGNAKGMKYGDARTADDDKAATEEIAVRASLYRQAVNYARESGGAPLTNDMRKVMIARAFREADPSTYPYAPGDRPFNVAASVREAITIRNDLRDVLGREPTQAEVDQYMREIGR